MHRAIRVPEPPPSPLAEDPRDDDDSGNHFGELLPKLDEETLDEEDEGEPSLGLPSDFNLDPELSDVTFDDQTAPDLRFGHDSVLPEANDEHEGDAAGFDAEPPTGQTEPEDALPPDAEERDGIDDARPFVSELDLPALNADDDGGDGDALRFGGLLAVTELAWPSALAPWQVTRLSPERERCTALAIRRGTVVAGSTDLLWLDAGRSAPVRLALDGARIATLALLGEVEDTIVAVTVAGRVLRRARLASDSERLGDAQRANERQRSERESVELCALGPNEPRSLLIRSALGLVEQSDDAGSSFLPLEPRLIASALSNTAAPLVLIADSGRELLVSRDGGRTFVRHRLEGVAAGVARGSAPLVAAAAHVVAIVNAERGMVLSTDGGARFQEIPGCATATACTVGVHDGRAYVWLALYSEATDVTRIVMVDTERADAEVIVKLAGSGDDDELGANARVERLGWDGTRLFAVGDPGFVLLEPPREPRH